MNNKNLPCRIQAIGDKHKETDRSYIYYIYQINTITEKWERVLLNDDSWLDKKDTDSKSYQDYKTYDTKIEAIDKIKERAEIDELPFFLQTGYLDRLDNLIYVHYGINQREATNG